VARIDVALRMEVAELQRQAGSSERGSAETGFISIGAPHRLRVAIGDRAIELTPGGRNSATMIVPGAVAGKGIDTARVGQITSNSGDLLLTRDAALALAAKWCRTAELALDRVSAPPPAADGPAAWVRPRPICVLETPTVLFLLGLSGPDDDPGGAAYRVTMTFKERR